jgi:hypothetical protein
MKATVATKNRYATRRAAALTHLGQIGPFIEGHFSAFKRPGCAQPGWHLTFKQRGTTRNYQRLKKLIREVTRHSLGLIRSHVANRRAAHRNRVSTKPKAPKV